MRVLLAALLLTFGTQTARATDPSKQSVEALIDDLAIISASQLGIDDAGIYRAFLADDTSPQFAVGLFPTHAPAVDPAMRELVRRGVAAVPALLAHLDDARPTRLTVGSKTAPLETFGGQFFAEEYDPRNSEPQQIDCFSNNTCRSFEKPYRVKIGDVCEVLIGQIVNRVLLAVRYQPTAIVLVNSPVETPALAARIRKDWQGVDATALEASLLSDLRSEAELDDWHGYRAALVRLRFYYPKTYAALAGDDLRKRRSFEAEEQKERANQ